MLTYLVLYPIAVMACWQIIEIWNHSILFDEIKEQINVKDEITFIDYLMICPFCLSPWVATSIAFIIATFVKTPDDAWPWFLFAVIYGQAIARGANFMNDLFYDFCRSPGHGLPDMTEDLIPITSDVSAVIREDEEEILEDPEDDGDDGDEWKNTL